MERGPMVPIGGGRGTRERQGLLSAFPTSHLSSSHFSSTLKPQGSFENTNLTLPLLTAFRIRSWLCGLSFAVL